jgi:hypothetical protein
MATKRIIATQKSPALRPRKKSSAVAGKLPPGSPEKQIAGFLAKFAPAIAQQIRAARAILAKRFPAATQIVYDNYNFFAIGFSTTARTSDTLFSIAANAKGLGLHFYWGVKLPDPHQLLQGSGNQNRFLRLPTPDTLHDAKVIALLYDAVAVARTPLPSTGRGPTLIRRISAKQRPRR